MEQKYDVFISHSSVDTPFLRLLANLLTIEGIAVWLDEFELGPGDSLIERVGEAIENTPYLLVAISKHSVHSKWVAQELTQALTLEMRGGKPRIIPIRLDEAPVPSYIADKVYADFSSNDKMPGAIAALVRAIKAPHEPRPVTYRDHLEQELVLTTLRDGDVRPALYFCNMILTCCKHVLATYQGLGHKYDYDQIPPIRVLLFTIHPDLECARLQMYVSESVCVVNCQHRFTLDKSRQPHLSLVARAWNSQSPQQFSYSCEYFENQEQYLAESERFGFDRDKVAHIVIHIASAVAFVFERCRFRPSGITTPIGICIDSERKNVFPEDVIPILQHLITGIVADFSTGRLSPLEFEERDFMRDNRGIIDECTDVASLSSSK